MLAGKAIRGESFPGREIRSWESRLFTDRLPTCACVGAARHAKVDLMTDISVRSLGEDDWQDYRLVRLAALRESPEAFVATVDEEEAFDDDLWRERMRRSARLVAERRIRSLQRSSSKASSSSTVATNASGDSRNAASRTER